MFHKPFLTLSGAEITELAEHSRKISAALADCTEVIFPSVLASDNQSITYETVDCSKPLLARLQAATCSEDDMERAGRILRHIHAAGILHADYVPHNLFYHDNKLVLIDPHPPERLPFKREYLYGDSSNEVAGFIFCLLTDAGLKRVLLHFKTHKIMIAAFLHGYGKVPLRLHHFIHLTKDSYSLRRQAGYTRLHAFIHVTGGCLMSYYAVRICS